MPQYANEVPVLDVADKIGRTHRAYIAISGETSRLTLAARVESQEFPEILGGGGAAPLADFLDADAAPQQLVDYFK